MKMTEVDVYDILTRERLFSYEAWDVPRANDRIFKTQDYVVIYARFFTSLPNSADVYVLGA